MRKLCGRPLTDFPTMTCRSAVSVAGNPCAMHREPSNRPALRRVEALENLREEVRRMNRNVQSLLRRVENMRV